MTRREIRPNRARVVGNILPVYSEMMKDTSYEVFNCKQEENGTTKFKDIQSTTRNLYSLNRGSYYISNIKNWTCEKLRSGTGLTTENSKKLFVTDDGVNVGRGYLSIYNTPVIYDITNPVNPTQFIFHVDLDYDNNHAYTLLGFVNSAKNNMSPAISKKIDNLVTMKNSSVTNHNLEYKLKGGIVYLFCDELYTGQYLDISNQVKDLQVAFYDGTASSKYTGLVVHSLSMEKMDSIYPASYLVGNIDVWVTNKKKSGTGVSDNNIVLPFVNEETFNLNAGRGNCVYLKKAVINQYNQELLDAFTLTAEINWDTGTGQEVLFGELNSDGTDITGAFKKALNIICDDEDLTDTLKLDWKCKEHQAYLFVNNKYTGITRELNDNTDYSFGVYNNKDLNAANVDGVEIKSLQVTNTCDLFPMKYQILNLNNWRYNQYTGSSATTLQDPTVTDDEVDIGGGHYAYLNAPILKDNNVDYVINLTFTGNYQRLGFGKITTESNKIKPTGIDRAIFEFTHDITHPHTITYKTLNNIAYLFFDNKFTGYKYNYSNETSNIFIGFYDNNLNTGIKIQNIEALSGTLTERPDTGLLLPPALGTDWTEITVSTFNGTPGRVGIQTNKAVLGAYERNVFKKPFSRSKKYIVKFRDGSNAYIGLCNHHTTPDRWETVQVNYSSNEFVANTLNTMEFTFDGEYIEFKTNDGNWVATKRFEVKYGKDLYLIEHQNNENTVMMIEEIREVTVPLIFDYDDFTYEDVGSGDNTLCITPTGAIMGYGGFYYYNTKLMNGKTYEITFQYGEDTTIGLSDTTSTETVEIGCEYQLPTEHVLTNGLPQKLLIKLNGGRITFNLNDEADMHIEHGLQENYDGLYLYQYSVTQNVTPMVINEIKEYSGG